MSGSADASTLAATMGNVAFFRKGTKPGKGRRKVPEERDENRIDSFFMGSMSDTSWYLMSSC